MKVPFVSIGRQYDFLREEFIKTFDEVGSSGQYIMSEGLSEFETKLSNLIKDYLIRGRIIIHVEYEADNSSDNGLILNENLLKQFVNTATKAGKILNISKLPDIDFFLNQSDIIKTDLDIDKEQIENCLEKP